MQEKREGRRLVTAFTAGGLSATCSTLMFQPLDLVKTRMQMRALAAPLCLATATVQGGAASVGMVGTFVHVVQRENITGLWRGTSPVRETGRLAMPVQYAVYTPSVGVPVSAWGCVL
jgi:hypothetical protein